MKGLKHSVPFLRRFSMRGLTIRARLLMLSGFLLALMMGSNLFLRSEIVAEQATLEADSVNLKEINATLQSGNRTLKDIGQTMDAGTQALELMTCPTF